MQVAPALNTPLEWSWNGKQANYKFGIVIRILHLVAIIFTTFQWSTAHYDWRPSVPHRCSKNLSAISSDVIKVSQII